jgi:hypothetical protein
LRTRIDEQREKQTRVARPRLMHGQDARYRILRSGTHSYSLDITSIDE